MVVPETVQAQEKMMQGQSTIIEKVSQVALPLCRAENFELVHLELASSNRQTIVRLYLDKPGGITLEDCAYASRQLGDLIDVHVEELGSYRLEVSSPGPCRPLNDKKDFIRFQGERIKIETCRPVEDRKRFTGTLEMIKDDSVVLDVDGSRIEISDHLISKANLAGQ